MLQANKKKIIKMLIHPFCTNQIDCMLIQATTWWSGQLYPQISGYAKFAIVFPYLMKNANLKTRF